MDLIITDADSKNVYLSKAVSAHLDMPDLLFWQLEDQKLDEAEYCLETVTEAPASISRVVLLTIASHGMMGYHKRLVRNNPGVKYWIIVLPDTIFSGERQQLIADIREIFQHQTAGYSVLFEKPESLKETASMLRHTVPEKPQCVLYYTRMTPVVQRLCQTIVLKYPNWEVACNPENLDWTEKYAGRILLFAEELHTFSNLAKINNADRIFVWIEGKIGVTVNQKKECIHQTAMQMQETGFSLINEKTHILYGFSNYEQIQAEINSDMYSYMALQNNSAFIMWDEYGLPLLNKYYEDATAQHFLDMHSVLGQFLGV